MTKPWQDMTLSELESKGKPSLSQPSTGGHVRNRDWFSDDALDRAMKSSEQRRANMPTKMSANMGIEWAKTFRPKALDEMDVITFATKALGVSFKGRPAQELVLRLIYGMPLPAGRVEVYVECSDADGGFVLEPRKVTWFELYRMMTGNQTVWEPGVEKTDTQLVVGRRGGKSHTTAIVTLYEATRKKYRKHLNKGEFGYAVITATRQKQAQDILLATCIRMLQTSPIKYLIDGEPTASELRLKNRMRIVAYPCNSKAALGLPMFFLAFDELAHFMVQGVKADREVIEALRPGMQQFAAAKPKMFAISTPKAKQGYFWDEYRKGFEQPDKLLVQAPSWIFNPPSAYGDPGYEFLKAELRKVGPDSFDREYRAQFAEQVSALLTPEQVNAVSIVPNGAIPPARQHIYFAGIDQSGLSGRDRFAFAISHREMNRDRIVVDFVDSWDTEDVEEVVPKIRALCQSYGIHSALIDRYAAGWVQSMLKRVPLEADIMPGLPKVWMNFKNLVVAQKVELPDRPTLRKAIVDTQIFYSKANTPSIVHERDADGHGDEADAVAYAVMNAATQAWLPTVRSYEQEMLAATTTREEAEYNPLTWGLN